MIVLNSLALIFLVHLIVFHIELKHKGLTTFEYLRLKESLETGVKRESKTIIFLERMPDSETLKHVCTSCKKTSPDSEFVDSHYEKNRPCRKKSSFLIGWWEWRLCTARPPILS